MSHSWWHFVSEHISGERTNKTVGGNLVEGVNLVQLFRVTVR